MKLNLFEIFHKLNLVGGIFYYSGNMNSIQMLETRSYRDSNLGITQIHAKLRSKLRERHELIEKSNGNWELTQLTNTLEGKK